MKDSIRGEGFWCNGDLAKLLTYNDLSSIFHVITRESLLALHEKLDLFMFANVANL